MITKQFEFNNHKYNLYCSQSASNRAIIALHGFTGSGLDWNFLTPLQLKGYTIIAPDLPGHGLTGAQLLPEHYSAASQIEFIKQIIEKHNLNEVVLLGYSMGARLALSFAVEHPSLVNSLIIESGTAGLAEEEKPDRVKKDLKVCNLIEKEGLKPFFDFWFGIPLFNSLNKMSNIEEIKQLRCDFNSTSGLVNSLKYFGAGVMPSVWKKLNSLSNTKVLFITGEYDDKYFRLANRMQLHIKSAKHAVIKEAGHNTHLEKPYEFIKLVNEFIA